MLFFQRWSVYYVVLLLYPIHFSILCHSIAVYLPSLLECVVLERKCDAFVAAHSFVQGNRITNAITVSQLNLTLLLRTFSFLNTY